jgi:biopolymer transport protein ExbB/TolQ
MSELFESVAKAFEQGGWGMYPIAATLVFALAIMFDRVWILYFKANIDKETFLRGLKKHIYSGDLDKAISYWAGLINVPKGEDDVQAAMDEATLRESPRIEKRTGYLAMIGNVATLLGLLGTITGLIKCFSAVGSANPADKANILSQGISEAMNCTAFGLGVAIPSLVLYSVLQGRTQSMVDDINETAVGVLNLIVANKDKMKMPATVPAEAEE